jgi:hypothetical protein
MQSIRCPHQLQPNDDLGWLGREPTLDEREIVEWLRRRRGPSRILHVGIGNSLLSKEFGKNVAQAMTKDGAEARNAEALGVPAILCNKYDVGSYVERLLAPFDLIVDVNIRSYACCDRHFVEYLEEMLEALGPNGSLVTSRRGLEYLMPTSIDALKVLASSWSVRSEGNVVIMRPRVIIRVRKWWNTRNVRTAYAG